MLGLQTQHQSSHSCPPSRGCGLGGGRKSLFGVSALKPTAPALPAALELRLCRHAGAANAPSGAVTPGSPTHSCLCEGVTGCPHRPGCSEGTSLARLTLYSESKAQPAPQPSYARYSLIHFSPSCFLRWAGKSPFFFSVCSSEVSCPKTHCAVIFTDTLQLLYRDKMKHNCKLLRQTHKWQGDGKPVRLSVVVSARGCFSFR